MSSNTRVGSSGRRLAVVTLVALTGVLLLPPAALAEPMPVTAPVIPGTPRFPEPSSTRAGPRRR